MAYAAVDSLIQTIDRVNNSRGIFIAQNSSREIIRFLLDELFSLQLVLEKWNRRRVKSEMVDGLDGLMRERVSELEQTLVSHMSNQFGSQNLGGQVYPFLLSLDLEELKQDIDSFVLTINELKKDVDGPSEEIDYYCYVHDDDDDIGIYEPAMVGLSDEFVEIRDRLINKSSPSFTLFGMAGIGKTTLAKKLLLDPLISSKFVMQAFVRIGPKYQLHAVLLDILKQVNPDQFDKHILIKRGTIGLASLKRTIFRSLMHCRYLIVLDDVWDEEIWDDLKPCFPDNKNGGSNKNDGNKVLLTTRLRQVAKVARGRCKYHIRFLNEKESWHLLRKKVFGEGESSCPHELEKPGKKISEYCEGLPLTILTVADIISKSGEKDSPEYWNKIASHKQNSVFTDAYERMLTVLYPSYNYLPQQLKTSFLYMGVFPQNHEITCSRLINLWRAEGFSGAHLDVSSEYCYNRLAELSSRSIVVLGNNNNNHGKKTCTLHSSFWYLCNKEAAKNKFFYSLTTLGDVSAESLESQCRLSIRNNVLLGIKGAFGLIEPISTVHSLLCTGPYHQYPVPICMSSRFLKILDAITIRFYEFPMELLNLVQLTYLALTFNGKLPASISKLWNLEYLIVHRHMSIIESDRNSSYLPIDIWDMQALKHLEITGCNLPGAFYEHPLPFLSTLVDVGPQSCTKDVLSFTPRLQKLGIRIQSVLEYAVPFTCFDHISHLHGLRSFKCIIVNPEVIMSKFVAPPLPLSIFPSCLRKLSLSGLGYPWEEITKISSLPNLRVLKLRCYAFRGPEWEIRDYEFQYLEYLLIEDSDLVLWTFPDYSGLYALKSLSIKHCYNLKEIPRKLFAQRIKKIELVDCDPSIMTCAKEFKEDHGHTYGHVSQLVLTANME